MWCLPSLKSEIIGFFFGQRFLICSWIQPSHTGGPYVLKAYRKIALPETVIVGSRLFNATFLTRHMQAFIDAYHLHYYYAVFGIDGVGIGQSFESFTWSEAESFTTFVEKKYCATAYLYSENDRYNVFYMVHMPPEILLQYVTLAASINLNLIGVIPPFILYKAVYTLFYGDAFRKVQLARDMNYYSNHLERFFTRDRMARLLTFPYTVGHAPDGVYSLLVSLGLFLVGSSYENNQFSQYPFAQ